MAEATHSAEYALAKMGAEPPRCDHICRLDEGHVERGEVHQYGYELPSPREDRYQEGYDAGFADGMECVCDETSMRNCPVHQNDGSPEGQAGQEDAALRRGGGSDPAPPGLHIDGEV